MSSDASFQWVCQVANPFAREVLCGSSEAGVASKALSSVDEIHAGPLSRCSRVIDALVESSELSSSPESERSIGDSWGPVGRTLMVEAPRAGYGKTHLVARLEIDHGGRVTVLPLSFDSVESVSWRRLLRQVLEHFRVVRTASEEMKDGEERPTLWQETGRRFFAEACLAAADEGGGLDDSVPAFDRELLDRDYARLLAPEAGSELREWILENGYRLGEAAGPVLARRWQIDHHDLPMWIDAFRRSALDSTSADEGSAMLRSLLPSSGEEAEAIAKARLGELLRMASSCRPLLLVADHLDSFYGQADAAMPLATILASFRGMLRRGVMLLCVNQDVWESVFEGNLPSALADRLNGGPAVLDAISLPQAVELVRVRLEDCGASSVQTAAFLDLLRQREGWLEISATVPGLYPRMVLRRASAVWEWLVGRIEAASIAPAEAPSEVEAERPPRSSPTTPPEPDDFPPPPSPAPEATSVPQAPSGRDSIPLPFLGAASDRVAPARTPARGRMMDLDSIVNEIRSGGGHAVSERPSEADLPGGEVAAAVGANGFNGHTGQGAPLTGGAAGGAIAPATRKPRSSLSAHEKALRERVAAYRRSPDGPPWRLSKLERLITLVGERYPVVAQTHPQLGGQSFLRWVVRGRVVMLGFANTEDHGFWRRLSGRAAQALNLSSGDTRTGDKVVVFAPADGAFDRSSWQAALGVEASEWSADIIELQGDDLALLYAADDLIEVASDEELDATVRFVARRMDPFWRRLTRPLER